MGQGVFELESSDHSGSNIYFGHRSRKMSILGFREYAATVGAGECPRKASGVWVHAEPRCLKQLADTCIATGKV